MLTRAEITTKFLRDIGININHIILPGVAHNSKEAHKLAKNSKFKDIDKIENYQPQIIQSFYFKNEQRNKEKEQGNIKEEK